MALRRLALPLLAAIAAAEVVEYRSGYYCQTSTNTFLSTAMAVSDCAAFAALKGKAYFFVCGSHTNCGVCMDNPPTVDDPTWEAPDCNLYVNEAPPASTTAAPTAAVSTDAVAAQAVSLGKWHTGAVMSDGTVWTSGYNDHGQLADGSKSNRATLQQVLTGAQALALGGYHTAVVRCDGAVWTAGDDHNGALGDGVWGDRDTFQQVFTGAVAVTAGARATGILKSDGTLWTVGANWYGSLADGTRAERRTFQQVFSGVQAMSMGSTGDHVGVVKMDGTVWTAGKNDNGQLADGGIGAGFRATLRQVLTGAQAVSAGKAHTAVVKADGTVWTAGGNDNGQLADGTEVSRASLQQVFTGAQAVSLGESHTGIIKGDGTVWTAGYGNNGRLADGVESGPNVDRSTLQQVVGFSGARAIALGAYDTAAIRADGTLWTVGQNTYGMLADGRDHLVDSLIPYRSTLQQVFTKASNTTLSQPAQRGTTELDLVSTEGFYAGQKVVISDDGNAASENRTIASISPLVLTEPLENDYAVGSTVVGVVEANQTMVCDPATWQTETSTVTTTTAIIEPWITQATTTTSLALEPDDVDAREACTDSGASCVFPIEIFGATYTGCLTDYSPPDAPFSWCVTDPTFHESDTENDGKWAKCVPCNVEICEGDWSDFDPGYGGCDTYGPSGNNHDYCIVDSYKGKTASQVCPQCGQCVAESVASVTTPSPGATSDDGTRAPRTQDASVLVAVVAAAVAALASAVSVAVYLVRLRRTGQAKTKSENSQQQSAKSGVSRISTTVSLQESDGDIEQQRSEPLTPSRSVVSEILTV